MKVIIQSWNDQWRYEVEDDDGERISVGFRDTFSGCCARCLELVVAEQHEDAEADVAMCQRCGERPAKVGDLCVGCNRLETAAGGTRTDYEDLRHVCGDCGEELQIVRPGKYQCVNAACKSAGGE